MEGAETSLRPMSVAEAKARLLLLASNDTAPATQSWASALGAASVGVLVGASMKKRGSRSGVGKLVSLAVVARAAKTVLPIVLKALK